jgi:hypothetical protein
MLSLCSCSCIVFASVVLRLLLSIPLIKLIYESGINECNFYPSEIPAYAIHNDTSTKDTNFGMLLFQFRV